ncbi:5-methylcytosine rRNA methyltransferase NSUN4 [Chelonus insularis]|uniref:5-methylcytosine rRNA methyltransferase NSUN4 n=1 Tax=Chelonus insularis TaxID=460826 RepID=UPI00158A123D|nr:5-methylcytosine rRNA methyltransferase NSUN4 [Chelonus insularis]
MEILRRLKFNSSFSVRIRKRHTHGPDHWSILKKKITPKDKALAHFDDLYKSIYGSSWSSIRSCLLKENHKYIAVVNNFTESEEIIEKLKLLGAMNLRDLYEVHKRNQEERNARNLEKNIPKKKGKFENNDENEFSDKSIKRKLEYKTESEIQSLLPENFEAAKQSLSPRVKKNDEEEPDFPNEKPLDPIEVTSIEKDVEIASPEINRIIKPSSGLTSSALFEYIPATKIKGLDDYVLESEHYNYYTEAADFEIKVEKESFLNFPEHLKPFTFDTGCNSSFPSPRRTQMETFDYYLLDGASILPVLALDLKAGDRVLDMCAAPGGKSLVALQTLLPHLLVANDVKHKRLNHVHRVMEEYLGSLDYSVGKLYLTNQDARDINDPNIFNKILVDVPCTTDRHMVMEDDNNWFKPGRTKERLRLPELQTEILMQALKIVTLGGTVVYSTCTLSPIQNEGVVQLALKKCFEENGITMIVKNMEEGLAPLRFLYTFGDKHGFKYGHIILPTPQNNWGPMYFCKMIRVK